LDAPHHAVITGGSGGIGRAIALALARTRCAVTVNYVRNTDAAEEVVALIRAGGQPTLFKVTCRTRTTLPDSSSRRGRPSVRSPYSSTMLGLAGPRPVFDNTLADFDPTFAANVRSAFLVTQAVLPDMRDLNFGRLIFLWSAAAMTGGVISTAYASSKAAVVGMMHHYAASLAPWNITANAISPAFIETDIFAGIELPPAESPPLGRMGRSCRGCSDDRQLRIYDRPDDPGERWPIHDLRQRLGRTAALGAVGTVQRLRQAGRNTSKSISSLGLDRPLPRA
jgi:3-oxoacyl-[acyl-carrier protein] reductase